MDEMRTKSKILVVEILKWEGFEVKFTYSVSGSLPTLTGRLAQFLKEALSAASATRRWRGFKPHQQRRLRKSC